MASRSFWFLFGTAAIAIGVAASVYRPDLSMFTGHAPAANAATPRVEPKIAIETQRVTAGAVVEDIRAVGTLRPNESVVIAPEIAGRLSRIRFNEGDRVKAGDVLAEIDPVILKAELEKARSDVALARANHDRTTALAQQGTSSLKARDEAVANFQAAQTNVALAAARLEKATIAAPLSGIVGLRAVSVGAYLTAGTPIVELADVDTLKVDFRVPELQLGNVRTGQTVTIAADALPGSTFQGTIYAIDPIVETSGRAIRLRARVPNKEGRLSPGLFVRLQIVVEKRTDALLVPESAIMAEAGKTFVYRVDDGRAQRVEVVLGHRQPGTVEVRKGLARDDTVVTAGHQRLRNGSLVEVVSAKPGA